MMSIGAMWMILFGAWMPKPPKRHDDPSSEA